MNMTGTEALSYPQPSKVRRKLFGNVDHDESDDFLKKQIETLYLNDEEKWNFDFKTETPLKGRYNWQIVDPGENPFYCKEKVYSDNEIQTGFDFQPISEHVENDPCIADCDSENFDVLPSIDLNCDNDYMCGSQNLDFHTLQETMDLVTNSIIDRIQNTADTTILTTKKKNTQSKITGNNN